ncbi:hypothetical protein SMICM304S_03659 [Streptomyces microflavus]
MDQMALLLLLLLGAVVTVPLGTYAWGCRHRS